MSDQQLQTRWLLIPSPPPLPMPVDDQSLLRDACWCSLPPSATCWCSVPPSDTCWCSVPPSDTGWSSVPPPRCLLMSDLSDIRCLSMLNPSSQCLLMLRPSFRCMLMPSPSSLCLLMFSPFFPCLLMLSPSSVMPVGAQSLLRDACWCSVPLPWCLLMSSPSFRYPMPV